MAEDQGKEEDLYIHQLFQALLHITNTNQSLAVKMVWEQLSINKPHLAYLILGGFTSLFMLCSLFVKEKMYIGEATVATICGIIFGPHAANVFNPISWGNTDEITLECSRVVLVVQCFAVGVELPKAYMERHWKSVLLFLGPVMTYGWLATSLFIWWMVEPLTWLESLVCAACVTATDPVLASSVVGKGKFAKRIPKHLRDILSAESGCNDGMAFPFIYLSYYLIHYNLDAEKVTFNWFCNTVLYQCIFGATYGVLIGYLGRHAIKYADRKNLIDRESFLVFYFTLALFCAGTGATLGTDDLLVGFAAGVGFSNDGWFSQKTEESHVSNVIDLLLNLAYFVYLGSVIPWEQYSNPVIGLTPWRLVIVALLVLFFRRIPIVLALKPFIPDVKTWREALFAGHFGPIGVGAIFACILARAELQTTTTEPLAYLPTDPNSENYLLVLVIWPLTTFLVITSIIVHGSSIAVFTLGKRINTLTLTMSYTQANEDGPSWMNRLPRIQSTAKGSMSKSKDNLSVTSADEKMDYPQGSLPPIGVPGTFLRRQKNEDSSLQNGKAGGARVSTRRKSKWDSGMGPGGPISQSAIVPQRRLEPQESTSDTLTEKGTPSPSSEDRDLDQVEREQLNEKEPDKHKIDFKRIDEPELEAYEEGNDMVIEDEEGNVVSIDNIRGETPDQIQQHMLDSEAKVLADTSGEYAKGKYHPHEKTEGEEIEKEVEKVAAHSTHAYETMMKKFSNWKGWGKKDGEVGAVEAQPHQQKRGAAHAYQFGNTIIVEDEDGEVIKKYDIPPAARGRGRGGAQNTGGSLDMKPMRQGFKRMGTWAGIGGKDDAEAVSGEGDESGAPSNKHKRKKSTAVDPDDDRIRFTVGTGGRRMSKQDFITQISQLDPRARVAAVEESDVPEAVKDDVREGAVHEERQEGAAGRRMGRANSYQSGIPVHRREGEGSPQAKMAEVQEAEDEDRPQGYNGLTLVDSNDQDIPFHPVADSVDKYSAGKAESAAQRRRRMAASRKDSDDDGTARVPPHVRATGTTSTSAADTGETQAEQRRRLAALGQEGAGTANDSSSSEDDEGPRQPKKGHIPIAEPEHGPFEKRTTGIRFADSPAVSQGKNIQWGEGVGKKGGR